MFTFVEAFVWGDVFMTCEGSKLGDGHLVVISIY